MRNSSSVLESAGLEGFCRGWGESKRQRAKDGVPNPEGPLLGVSKLAVLSERNSMGWTEWGRLGNGVGVISSNTVGNMAERHLKTKPLAGGWRRGGGFPEWIGPGRKSLGLTPTLGSGPGIVHAAERRGGGKLREKGKERISVSEAGEVGRYGREEDFGGGRGTEAGRGTRRVPLGESC